MVHRLINPCNDMPTIARRQSHPFTHSRNQAKFNATTRTRRKPKSQILYSMAQFFSFGGFRKMGSGLTLRQFQTEKMYECKT